MIKRYSRKDLTDIWSEENKYKIWLEVEVAAAEAMEKLGQIPKGVASIVRKKAKIDVKMLNDGWTAVTKDKSLSAQFEHTLGITENGYEIFTESAKGYSKPPYL